MAEKQTEQGKESKDKTGPSIQVGDHNASLQSETDLSDPKNSRSIQKYSQDKQEPVVDKDGHLSIPALENLTHSSQERQSAKREAAQKESQRKEAERARLEDERNNKEVKQIINGINSKVVAAASHGETSADIMDLGFTNHHGLNKYQQQVVDAIKARGLRPEVHESYFAGDELGNRTLTANWTNGRQTAGHDGPIENKQEKR